jgi:hypothetical protein
MSNRAYKEGEIGVFLILRSPAGNAELLERIHRGRVSTIVLISFMEKAATAIARRDRSSLPGGLGKVRWVFGVGSRYFFCTMVLA